MKILIKKYLLLSSVFFMMSCSSVPDLGGEIAQFFDTEVDSAEFQLNVDSQLNPDKAGRPSPLVLRFYQLNNDVQFRSLDLNTIYEQGANVLGGDLRTMNEVILFPGRSMSYDLDVFTDAKFLGILGAYQDETSVQPKLIIDLEKMSVDSLCLTIGSTSLRLC